MSDSYNETVRTVRALELRHSIDEMRAVRIEDGRNTIHEIQMRNEFGEWGSLVVGLSRRRKGDRHNAALGGALSLYRALVNLTERHREAFAKEWPEYFPKTPKEIRDARAAVRDARAKLDAAQAEVAAAKGHLDQMAKAEKILETGPQVVDCGEGRTVVEAWSVVALRALAVLRGETDA